MKILKKAEQKNVVIRKECYTIHQINEMLSNREICHFEKNYPYTVSYKPLSFFDYGYEETVLRIFTDNLNEIKVILDKDGYYTTVAVGKNGTTYFVEL